MEDKMININVVVADRPYRLKVSVDEEAMVRSAAKEINKKVKEYQQVFGSKDKQDFLAMIALQNTTEGMKAKGSNSLEDGAESEKLEAMDRLLSDFLSAK